MAKVSNKTKKIRFYRSRIRKLTGKKYKTKKAILHKKQQLYYLRSRLKTLTARKRTRHTHARTRMRARHHPQNEIDLDVRDRFISPRVVSIAASSGLRPVVPSVQPVASPFSASVSEIQGSVSPTGTAVSMDVSPLTNPSSSMVSNITPSTVAETDRSTSPVSTIGTVSSMEQPTMANTDNAIMGDYSSLAETEGNSLHLSDLNVSPPASSANSLASGQTSLETRL